MSALHVESPGLLTTVQDWGRWGFQSVGVPVAGAMDLVSHRVANALAGNSRSAATLEITISGPALVAEGPLTVAVAGADFSITIDGRAVRPPLLTTVEDGAAMAFGPRAAGARAYLAVSGGLDTPLVLGSRSADVRSGFPGLAGRALCAGDRIAVGTERTRAPRVVRVPQARLPAHLVGLRVLPGVHAGVADAFDGLLSRTWTISPQSDRMGFRLHGPALDATPPRALVSTPTVTGAVQVLPDGTPILLMADRQTTAGYAQAAVVIGADLPLAGQLAPGDRIRFVPCTREEALRALVAMEQPLLALEELP